MSEDSNTLLSHRKSSLLMDSISRCSLVFDCAVGLMGDRLGLEFMSVIEDSNSSLRLLSEQSSFTGLEVHCLLFGLARIDLIGKE